MDVAAVVVTVVMGIVVLPVVIQTVIFLAYNVLSLVVLMHYNRFFTSFLGSLFRNLAQR
jgi:hypothetical protein